MSPKNIIDVEETFFFYTVITELKGEATTNHYIYILLTHFLTYSRHG